MVSLAEESPHPTEGEYMHALAAELFPICRSITGDGVRQTLRRIQQDLPELQIHEVSSGTPVLDWVVPDEWNIREAYLEGPSGERIVDFADSNLHVVSYSTPVDTVLSREALEEHLHSDPDHPEAIPYVTSYYNRNWGFCLSRKAHECLPEGMYRAYIDSTIEPGSLTYADLVLPGESATEVLVTTYVCHPSLGNNELSGPMVATALARWLSTLARRRFTYRFVFAPETIGAITYIQEHLDHLRERVVGGINLTCIGDDGDWSYLASRTGDHALDRIGRRQVALRPQPKFYTYLDRGSDERQYGMPGVGVPMISLMRTKYGAYPEYHTSLDNLTVITPQGLQGGLDLVRDVIVEFEASEYFRATVLAEPQLGRRGLYPAMHAKTVEDVILLRTNILAYADGRHSCADMAEVFGVPENEVRTIVSELSAHGLLVHVEPGKDRA